VTLKGLGEAGQESNCARSIGDPLLERGVSPHIFESAADATRHLDTLEKGDWSA
jgi:hypothetical protein